MLTWFQETIVEQRRLPLFCFFVALILAFVVTRVHVRLIRAGVGWFRTSASATCTSTMWCSAWCSCSSAG